MSQTEALLLLELNVLNPTPSDARAKSATRESVWSTLAELVLLRLSTAVYPDANRFVISAEGQADSAPSPSNPHSICLIPDPLPFWQKPYAFRITTEGPFILWF